MSNQIPWSVSYRPGKPGNYRCSVRFYVNGRWQSRPVKGKTGGKFKDHREAKFRALAMAKELGFWMHFVNNDFLKRNRKLSL